jgi:hypothetical protein
LLSTSSEGGGPGVSATKPTARDIQELLDILKSEERYENGLIPSPTGPFLPTPPDVIIRTIASSRQGGLTRGEVFLPVIVELGRADSDGSERIWARGVEIG